jgi:formyl-CoA transferase
LYEIVSSSLAGKSTEDWLDVFETARIPAMPVLDLAEIENDPHVKATGFITQRTHATEGAYKSIGVPIDFSVSQADAPKDAPTVGQDSQDILAELGYSEERIREITDAGTQ